MTKTGRIIALVVVLAVAALIVFMVYMNSGPAISGETGNVPDKLIERNTVTEVEGSTREVTP